MLKIKFLILLSSILGIVSCGITIEDRSIYKSVKYSVDHLSGGQNAFIFKNVLTQQLIANNLFDEDSEIAILITMGEKKEYLSTSITKVASRKLNELSVEIETYQKNNITCIYLNNKYESRQSFLLAESSANLSNDAAQSEILLINSENIAIRIIDDLQSLREKECLNLE